MKTMIFLSHAVKPDHAVTFRHELERARKSVTNLFPVKHIDVVVLIDKETDGLWGNAFYEDAIEMSYDGTTLPVSRIAATFYHELHRHARKSTVGYGTTLGQAIISEGTAVAMEQEMGADVSVYHPCTEEQLLPALKELRLHQSQQSYSYHGWFTDRSAVPKFKGYNVGLHLVTEYCQRHNVKPSQLYNLPAEKILHELL